MNRNLGTCLDMIAWYRRCLEDVQHGRVVRGLDEAKVGYDRAMEQLRSAPPEIIIGGDEPDGYV